MSQYLREKLPVHFRNEVLEEDFEGLEEIRLRVGWPMELYYGNRDIRLIGRVCSTDLDEMLNYLTGYCLYAYEEQIRQGYFTIEGGHRVGVVGRTGVSTKKDGHTVVDGIWDISGLNIRIAHEKHGISMPIVPFLRKEDSIYNTLLIAEPGVGKTTCLRDCVRILSGGLDGGCRLKICVIDERSEIAACHQGVPQNDLGPRTDVLDNCPKRYGMQMALRSMSPQIIAVDELGREEDFEVLLSMLYSGVRVLGTIHAASIEEVAQKPQLHEILREGLIGRIVMLEKGYTGSRRFLIYDQNLHLLASRRA